MNVIDYIPMEQEYVVWKAVVKRFVKGFLAGGFAMAAMVGFSGTITDWADVQAWVITLLLSFFVGGITGAVLAGEKWSQSWK